MEGDLGVLAKVICMESVLIPGELNRTVIPMISKFSLILDYVLVSQLSAFFKTPAL